LPLKDIRILDLSTVMAAPFAATILGDFGAEVVKIENAALPDALRGWGVHKDGTQPWWLVFSRNKLPITLNLRAPEGAKIFAELVAQSDVLIENLRTGALDKLGFTAKRLFELNKGLIVGRISGYGQTGPYAKRPGFGTLAEGMSGYTYINAERGGMPINPPLPLADTVAGLHLAIGIMVALRGAKRSEYGAQEIDVSLYEPLFGLLGAMFVDYWMTGEIPRAWGNELGFTAPRNNYRTRDGRWVALSASAQMPFERLMDAVGKPEMKTDPRFKTNEARIKDENRAELNRVIAEWFATMDLDEAIKRCTELELTAGIIANMKDIAEDPHIRERKTLRDVTNPVTGQKIRMPDVPVRMMKTAGEIGFPGLPPGAANDVILKDLLGYSSEGIEELRKAKVI
jgi:crotonobetainyl-CoA:carnitine CoA-transferase CaiB-like acyl-CoA transferase